MLAQQASGIVTPKPVDGIEPHGFWTDDKLGGYDILVISPLKPNFCNVMAFMYLATQEMETAGLSIKQIQDNTGLTLPEQDEKEDEHSSNLYTKPKALVFNDESDTLLCLQQSAELLSLMAETQGQMNKSVEKLVSLQTRSVERKPKMDVREINLLITRIAAPSLIISGSRD